MAVVREPYCRDRITAKIPMPASRRTRSAPADQERVGIAGATRARAKGVLVVVGELVAIGLLDAVGVNDTVGVSDAVGVNDAVGVLVAVWLGVGVSDGAGVLVGVLLGARMVSVWVLTLVVPGATVQPTFLSGPTQMLAGPSVISDSTVS
jgi:hypothetical protein